MGPTHTTSGLPRSLNGVQKKTGRCAVNLSLMECSQVWLNIGQPLPMACDATYRSIQVHDLLWLPLRLGPKSVIVSNHDFTKCHKQHVTARNSPTSARCASFKKLLTLALSRFLAKATALPTFPQQRAVKSETNEWLFQTAAGNMFAKASLHISLRDCPKTNNTTGPSDSMYPYSQPRRNSPFKTKRTNGFLLWWYLVGTAQCYVHWSQVYRA